MPPKVKMYEDKARKQEIPFIGYPNKAITMGKKGSVSAYICNEGVYDYEIKEAYHTDPNAKVEVFSKVLKPFEPVLVKLSWTPPFSDNEEDWKPLKGDIVIKGSYVIV